MRKWWEEPIVLVPAGMVLAALLLAWFIIPSLGVAGAIIKDGLVGAIAAGLVAAWVVPAVASSLTVVVSLTTVFVLVNVAKKVQENPYDWILPVLAIFAGFVVDICKDFTPWRIAQLDIGKPVFAAITTALFFIAGCLWRRAGVGPRVVAVVVFLISPAWILADSYRQCDARRTMHLPCFDDTTWIGVSALVGILALVALIARVLPARR